MPPVYRFARVIGAWRYDDTEPTGVDNERLAGYMEHLAEHLQRLATEQGREVIDVAYTMPRPVNADWLNCDYLDHYGHLPDQPFPDGTYLYVAAVATTRTALAHQESTHAT